MFDRRFGRTGGTPWVPDCCEHRVQSERLADECSRLRDELLAVEARIAAMRDHQPLWS